MEKQTLKKQTAKKKENKRFILVVLGLVLAGAIVVGGLALYRISSSADRNARLGAASVAKGDELAAAGDMHAANEEYREGVDRIGRAVSKEPNQIKYLDQMLDAIARIQSESASEATEQFKRYLRVLEKRTTAQKRDVAVWTRYLDMLREQATIAREQEAWAMVAETAINMAERVGADSPGQIDSKYYQADAQIHRDAVLTDDERAKAEGQLREVLKARPDHEGAWSALLNSEMDDLMRKQHSLSTVDIGERIDALKVEVAAAETAVPDSGPVAIAMVRSLAVRQALGDQGVTDEMAQAAVSKLLAAAGRGDEWDLLESVTLLGAIGGENDLRAAVELLKTYVGTHPEALLHLRVLGLMQSKFDRAAAAETFKKLAGTPRLKVSLVGAFQDEIRVSAAESLFDVAFTDWELAKDDPARAAAITRMKELRTMVEEITRGRGGENLLNKIDGKIAFSERDFAKAASRLGKLLALDNEQPVEVYLLAAASEARLGEFGASRVLIDHALESHPDDARLVLARGDLCLRLGDSGGALAAANAILAVDPKHDAAQRLKSAAEAPTALDATVNGAGNDLVRGVISEAEAQLAQGQPAAALAILNAARAKDPNVRYTRAVVQLLINTNDLAGATREVEAGLAQFADDPGLLQQRIMAQTADPVERDIKFSESSAIDENDRICAEYLTLSTQLPIYEARVLGGGSEGIRAEGAKAVAEAKRRLPAARDRALAVQPSNATVIERFYDESARAGDKAGVERALEMASKSTNPALAALMRGRAALTSGQYQQAADYFREAIKSEAAKSAAYRLLGIANERLGDVNGALSAYAEAYRLRPNDPGTIELYGVLRGRSGDPAGGLEIMRAGARALPNNSSLSNAWLSLEADVGDRIAAIEFRRRIARQRIGDLENSRQLAALLASTPASPQMLRSADGRLLHTAAEWSSLPESTRAEALATKRAQNLAEAAALMRQVMAANPLDFQSAAVYAAGLFKGGEFGQAERVLRDYAASCPGDQKPRALFELGNFLNERGRDAEGRQAFADAIAAQTPGSSDVAIAVADYWFQRSKWAEAETALLAIPATQTEVPLIQRLAEIQMRQAKYAEAEVSLARTKELMAGKASFSGSLLEAGFYHMRGNSQWIAGKRAEAVEDFARMDGALESAIALEPGEATPHVLRSVQRQGQWARTGDSKAIAEAIKASQRAVELRGSFWASVRTLADQLAMSGNVKGAVEVVGKYVAANPRSWEGRRLLANLMAEGGDDAGGAAILEEALTNDASNVQWLDAISDFHSARGRHSQAALALERAYDLKRDTTYLLRAVQTRLQAEPFDGAGLQTALRARSDALVDNAFLAEALAAASAANPASRDSGRESLRQQFKNAPNALGGLDGWMLAVQAVFPKNAPAEFDQFVSSCAGADRDAMVISAIAEVYLNSGNNAQKAADLLREAIAKGTPEASNQSRLQLLLGAALFEIDLCDEARKAYESALTLTPENALVINNMAFLEAKCGGDGARAIELALKALAIRPGQPEFLDTLGMAQMKQGDNAEAQSNFLRALRGVPKASIWLHLAQSQFAGGAKVEAKQSIANARKLNPSEKELKELADLETEISAPAKQ